MDFFLTHPKGNLAWGKCLKKFKKNKIYKRNPPTYQSLGRSGDNAMEGTMVPASLHFL